MKIFIENPRSLSYIKFSFSSNKNQSYDRNNQLDAQINVMSDQWRQKRRPPSSTFSDMSLCPATSI
jgi:hypothetical protein